MPVERGANNATGKAASARAQAIAAAHSHAVEARKPVSQNVNVVTPAKFRDPIATLPVTNSKPLPQPRATRPPRATHARPGGSGQPGLPVDTDQSFQPFSKEDQAALFALNAHLAAPASTVLQNAGREAIGLGPGLVRQAIGVGKDLAAANRGDTSFKNTRAIGKAQLHSLGETIHHPGRQLVNDPLGLAGNIALAVGGAGAITGRGAAVADASGVGGKAAALVKTPQPLERTLHVGGIPTEDLRSGVQRGGETVHPLASANHAVGLVQKHVIDRYTQHMLDTGTDTLTGGRFVGPNVKVGREMRAEERFRTGLQQADGNRLGKYGQTRKARAPKDVVSERAARGGRLTAAQQKAVQIKASGRPVEEWSRLQENAVSHYESRVAQLRNEIKQGRDVSGNKKLLAVAERQLTAHKLQQGLTEGARQYLGDDTHPLVDEAAAASRDAIAKRESTKGMTEDDIAHRLGAHATQVQHLAEHGFDTETPVEQLARLEGEAHGFKPTGDGERAKLEERLAANQKEQHNPGYTPEQIQHMRDELAANIHTQRDPFSPTHLRSLRIREAELRNELERKHEPDPVQVRKLRAEEAQINERLQQIDKHDQIAALHQHLITEGHKVRENGGFYLPMQDELKKVTRGGMGARARASLGDYGVGPVKGEANHPYGGKLLRSGTYRTDSTNLAARASRDTERLAAAQRIHAKLWASSVAERKPGMVPIRETTQVPAELKRMTNAVDRGELHTSEYKPDVLAQTVESWFNPDHAAPGEKIRYVPENRLGPLKQYVPLLGPAGEAIDRLNQLVRIGRYGPAYIKWLPQNIAVTLVNQGPFVIRSLHSLMKEVHKLDPVTYEKLSSLAGTGSAHGLEGDTRFLGKTQSRLANFWAKTDDHVARMIVLIHQLHRAGFKSAEDWTRLVNAPVGSKLEQKAIEIGRRSNREAIDYGAQTNAERATLKKVVVSWPWLSAASRWSARFPFEHPFQFHHYANAGEQGYQDNEKYFEEHGGTLPAYLEAALPSSHGSIDTAFLNAAETPGKLMEGMSGLIPGQPSRYRGELASELAAIPTATYDAIQGITKYGSTDKSGKAPYMQLAKSFAPVGDALLATKPNTGAAPGGVGPALGRLLGSPVTKTNVDNAAKSGMLDLKAKGSPRDVWEANYRINEYAIQKAVKSGQVSKADAGALREQNKLARRVAQIKGGTATKDLTPQQDRQMVIAQAAFQNEHLDSLNTTLDEYGLPHATQTELDGELRYAK